MLSWANKVKLTKPINYVVSGHAIYLKALEVQEKHQEKFGLMAFIAKRFFDAGFRGVVVESGVIVGESIGGC